MLAILDRRGYPRPAHTTPSEFITSIKDEIPEIYVQEMTSLTELFYRARFGHHTLSKEEQLSVKNALRRLQEMH